MTESRFTVSVIEDKEEYRTYIKEELSINSSISDIFFYPSGEAFFHSKEGMNKDLYLIDISLPYMNGIEVLKLILKNNPEAKAVMLTNLQSEEIIFDALKNGAIGYVLKSDLGNLKNVIEIVMNGGGYMSPTIALRIMQDIKKNRDKMVEDVKLSEKEGQILQQISTGKKNGDIARSLEISENTVKYHVKNIYKKLHVSSRVELMNRTATKQ